LIDTREEIKKYNKTTWKKIEEENCECIKDMAIFDLTLIGNLKGNFLVVVVSSSFEF